MYDPKLSLQMAVSARFFPTCQRTAILSTVPYTHYIRMKIILYQNALSEKILCMVVHFGIYLGEKEEMYHETRLILSFSK